MKKNKKYLREKLLILIASFSVAVFVKPMNIQAEPETAEVLEENIEENISKENIAWVLEGSEWFY